MSGNANTDVRNTRLLSLAGYERVMGGEGMEGGPCLAISTAALKCCSAQLLAGHCVVQQSDLRDQDCELGEGRGTLIGIMGAVTRGDGRE